MVTEKETVDDGRPEERKRHKKEKKHKKEKHKKHKERKQKDRLPSPDTKEGVSDKQSKPVAEPVAAAAEATQPLSGAATPESGELNGRLAEGDRVQKQDSQAVTSKPRDPTAEPTKRTAERSEEAGPSKRQKPNDTSLESELRSSNGTIDRLPGPPDRDSLARRDSQSHGRAREEQHRSSRHANSRSAHEAPRHLSGTTGRDSRRRSPDRRSESGRDSRSYPDGRRRDDRLRERSASRRREDDSRRSDHRRRDDDLRHRSRESDRHNSRRRSSSRSRRDRDRRHGRSRSQEKEDKEFAEKVIAKLEEDAVDEDALIEERRRRRQELLAKIQEEQQAAAAVAQPTASQLAQERQTPPSAQIQSPPVANLPSVAPTAPVPVLSEGRTATPEIAGPSVPASPGPSTTQQAEAQPDSDTEDEEGLDETTEDQLFQQRKEPLGQGEGQQRSPTPASSDERHKIQNQEKQTRQDFDMFAGDSVEDMFGDEPVAAPGSAAQAAKRGLLDNYDDSEGYYNFQVGEMMDERYEVFATHGKGVFSTVLRARDRKPVDEKGRPVPVIGVAFPEVAIKVIRANDIMSKAGQTEVVILRKLAGADPSNKYHIIRLLRTFEYRHHLCLVFEPLESNLRQLTKKYGQGIGLRLDAVRSMAAQMLMALHLMKQCGVLHADIKPDNILINRGHNVVKMCDFGSAMFTGNNEITPYLVSRFYRAPEIILGLHYDHPMDVWSIGCVIFELFTGRILFPGRTNNEMLRLMMDAKGPFPKKMLKKGEFSLQHFEDDPNMSFCQMEIDALTKRPAKRLVPNPTVKKDFKGLLAGQEGEARQVANLVDLLEKMMHLDPEKRISAKEALRHAFIKDGRPPPRSHANL